MSILNPRTWFGQRAPAAEAKASAAGPIISANVLGQPVWTPRRYDELAREAYIMNAVSYRCVRMIAGAAASTDILLHRADKEIDTHPLLDLLARPNPRDGGHALLEAFFIRLLLSGNGYLEAVGPREMGEPRELWSLRSDHMQVIAGPHGIPQAYRYSAGGRSRDWKVDPLTGQSDVLHVREFHPLDDWYGMSRVEAAAYGVDRHNAYSQHNKALLDNGARPSGALVFEPIPMGSGEGAVAAPESVIKAAEAELRERHMGGSNAGKPMVLGGKVSWQEMGLSPRDMDFMEGKDDAARDICLAYGVPFTLLVKGQSTYNNVSEAKLELYEDTVLPLLDRTLDAMNNWLCPRFGEDFRLVADRDSISALEPRRVARRASITDLLDKGVIDADEAREALQYGDRKDGALQKVEPQVITALLSAVETVGMDPLLRYMRAVGLLDPKMTDEQVLARALALVEDDDDEEDDDTPPTDTPDEEDDSDVDD